MAFLSPLIWAMLLPALAGAACCLIARQLRARGARAEPDTPAPMPWLGAIAISLAAALSHFGLIGWPQFPPIDVTSWPMFLSIAAVVTATAVGAVNGVWWLKWPERIAFSVLVPWLVLQPLIMWSWEGSEKYLFVGGIAAAFAVLWTSLDQYQRRVNTFTFSVLLLGYAAAASGLLILSGSALLGQLAGAIAAVCGVLVPPPPSSVETKTLPMASAWVSYIPPASISIRLR